VDDLLADACVLVRAINSLRLAENFCVTAEQRGEVPVIWTIKVDPRGLSQLLYRCKHVNQTSGSPMTQPHLHRQPHAPRHLRLSAPSARPSHSSSASPAGVQDHCARRVRVHVRPPPPVSPLSIAKPIQPPHIACFSLYTLAATRPTP
jgi:hypothetical protein